MSLDIRFVKRGAPRVRTHRTKVGLARKKLRVLLKAGEVAEAVLDLSTTGMKLVVKSALEKDDVLLLEILHPSFHGAIVIDGTVRWVRKELSDRWSVGVEFARIDERAKRQIDRVLALELGSTVAIGGQHSGWIARGTPESGLAGTLFVYDLDRNEVGRIVSEGAGSWRATRTREGKVEQQKGDVFTLAHWLLGGKKPDVKIDPPI